MECRTAKRLIAEPRQRVRPSKYLLHPAALHHKWCAAGTQEQAMVAGARRFSASFSARFVYLLPVRPPWNEKKIQERVRRTATPTGTSLEFLGNHSMDSSVTCEHHSGRQWRRQLRTEHTFSRISGLREHPPPESGQKWVHAPSRSFFARSSKMA